MTKTTQPNRLTRALLDTADDMRRVGPVTAKLCVLAI